MPGPDRRRRAGGARLAVGLAAALTAAPALPWSGTPGPPVAWADAVDDPPEPVLVVPGADLDGTVSVQPDVQGASASGRVTWIVSNGSDRPVELRLRVHEVVVDDGTPTVGDRLSGAGLATDRLALAPGEAARVVLPSLPSTDAGLVALLVEATGADASVEASGLATDQPLASVSVGEVRVDGEAVTVELVADGASVVDVSLRWSGLGRGTLAETTMPRVVVPAGGRQLQVRADGIAGPRSTVDVAVRVLGSEEVARGSATAWSVAWVLGLVVAVAVAAAGGLGLRALGQSPSRRGRRHLGDDAGGDDHVSPGDAG